MILKCHGEELAISDHDPDAGPASSNILFCMALPAGDRQLLQIVDAALTSAASRAGAWLACRPGCTQCCHGTFAINQLDAQRIASGMETLRTRNPDLAAELHNRAKAWIDEHGPGFPGDPRTGILGGSDADHARFEDYANQAPCPALDPSTGLCDIYQWRPMTCRVFGPPVRIQAGVTEASSAIGHCELCFIGATTAEIAACEMPVPNDLEQKILSEIPVQGETIVPFALLR